MLELIKNVWETLKDVIKKPMDQWSAILLLFFIFMPTIGTLASSIHPFTDWFTLNNHNIGYLLLSIITGITFLWLFLYYTILHYLRQRVVIKKSQDGEPNRSHDIKNSEIYFRRFKNISIVIVFLQILQLGIINYHALPFEEEGEFKNLFILFYFSLLIVFALAWLMLSKNFPWIKTFIDKLFTPKGSSESIGRQQKDDRSLRYLISKHISQSNNFNSNPPKDKDVEIYIEYIAPFVFWLIISFIATLFLYLISGPTSTLGGEMLISYYVYLLVILCFTVIIFLVHSEYRNPFFNWIKHITLSVVNHQKASMRMGAKAWFKNTLLEIKEKCPLLIILIVILCLLNIKNIPIATIFATDSTSNKNNETLVPVTLNCPEHMPAVIIAASGGGISASAWTAQSLSYIQQKHPQLYSCIFAISSVSGGSLGAYYHIAENLALNTTFSLSKKRPEKQTNLSSENLASRSSLGAVGWAIPGAVLPILTSPDNALKERWTNINCSEQDNKNSNEFCSHLNELISVDAKFSKWDKFYNDKNVPHLLINSTNEVSGQRIIFSTDLDFHDQTKQNPNNDYDYSSTEYDYVNKECIQKMRVIDAVKHSATFPIVTESERINNCNHKNPPMLIDGGYIDNDGIQTALDYISYLKQKGSMQNRRFLIVNINAFPSIKESIKGGKQDSQKTNRLNRLASPLKGLTSLRRNHPVRNHSDIKRAENVFMNHLYFDVAQHSNEISRSKLKRIVLPNNGKDKDLPLSWHLSLKDKQRIKKSFKLEQRPNANTENSCKNVTTAYEKGISTFHYEKGISALTQLTCVKNGFDALTKAYPIETTFSKNQTIKITPYDREFVLQLNGKYKTKLNKSELIDIQCNIVSFDGAIVSDTPCSSTQTPTPWIVKFTQHLNRTELNICEGNTKPKLVAYSPMFESGYPKTRNESSNFSLQKNSAHLSYVKNHLIENSLKKGGDKKIISVGFASKTGYPSSNFDLAERRADWLKFALKEIYKELNNIETIANGEQIIPIDEQIDFGHPEILKANKKPSKDQHFRFAAAYICE